MIRYSLASAAVVLVAALLIAWAAERTALAVYRKQVMLAYIEALRRENPPPRPTEVYFERLENGLLGYTDERAGEIQVVIGQGLNWQVTVDVLVHEWAHAVCRDVPQPDPHGLHWGIAYAACYRTLQGVDVER